MSSPRGQNSQRIFLTLLCLLSAGFSWRSELKWWEIYPLKCALFLKSFPKSSLILLLESHPTLAKPCDRVVFAQDLISSLFLSEIWKPPGCFRKRREKSQKLKSCTGFKVQWIRSGFVLKRNNTEFYSQLRLYTVNLCGVLGNLECAQGSWSFVCVQEYFCVLCP